MAMPAAPVMRTATLRDRKGASDQVSGLAAHVVLKYGTQCSCRSVPYTRPTYLVTPYQRWMGAVYRTVGSGNNVGHRIVLSPGNTTE